MEFISTPLSVVEWIAVIVAALVVLAVIIGFFTNLGGLVRYLRTKRM